ncbi:MAG: helix-turn-helix domain-containing protein [Pyrinomonadaceae bacterium]
MDHTDQPKSGSNIDEKLDYLRETAFALIREVRRLDGPKRVELEDEINFDEEVRRFEVYLIERALERTGGNQHRAARLLKLKYTTLHSKIKRYRIKPAEGQFLLIGAADH